MAAQEPSWQNAYRTEMNPLNHAGILLLSSTLQVMYLNPDARALLRDSTLCSSPAADLPPAIRSFCHEIIQRLPPSPGPTDWEGLRLSRVTGSLTRPILVRAFGVPAPLSGDGQLLVLIERAQPTDTVRGSHPSTTKQLNLTPRETSVMRYLLQGLTNKEIANKLGLSQHTVKDHLKRLMKKTHVTTRTALVSRLLNSRDWVAELTPVSAIPVDSEIYDLAV